VPRRPRFPLVFGPGLDRETGVMAIQPGSMEDLRNVYLHTGKLVLRRGYTSRSAFVDEAGVEMSHVIGIHPLRSERIGVVACFQETTNRVLVYRVEADGTGPELVGEWVNDQVWSGVPRVIMADSYGRVLLAHEEQRILRRAPTLVYDPFFGGSPLTYLQHDGDGSGSGEIGDPIRFRGVVRWLNYMFGWGWGSPTENRPELVRVSKPGEPTVFLEGSYFIAGDRQDPTLAVLPGRQNLVVLKGTDSYAIIGYDKATFGIRPLDPLYGVLSPRLAFSRAGDVFFWSPEGPRITDGSSISQDLNIPLDLGGFQPSDLPELGEAAAAFAAYKPEDQVLSFIFGRRGYALTLRVSGDWKWSYEELGVDVYCAGILFGGDQTRDAPEGHPEYDGEEVGGTFADIDVRHVGQDGDESMEVWARPAAGTWTLRRTVLVSPTLTQVVRVENLTAGAAYEVALRYRRGTLYGVGYTSASPSDWPEVSRGSFTTTIDPPIIADLLWSRTGAGTEQIAGFITVSEEMAGIPVNLYRESFSTETPVATIADPVAGPNAITDGEAFAGEAYHVYRATHDTGLVESPRTNAYSPWGPGMWAGPALYRGAIPPATGAPPIDFLLRLSEFRYTIGWIAPLVETGWEWEVWDSLTDMGNVPGAPLTTLRATLPNGARQWQSDSLPTGENLQIWVTVRGKRTTFGTPDFTPFEMFRTVVLLP
jgi:hypothetical protein